jgi:tRNA-dihydrouridine synthase B
MNSLTESQNDCAGDCDGPEELPAYSASAPLEPPPKLAGFNIGPVEIKDPVILAPLSGITDMPFRRLVKQHGAGLVVSEMIASAAVIRDCKKTKLMAKNMPEEFPMSVQLAGCEPEVMAEAAKLNEDSGAACGLRCVASSS